MLLLKKLVNFVSTVSQGICESFRYHLKGKFNWSSLNCDVDSHVIRYSLLALIWHLLLGLPIPYFMPLKMCIVINLPCERLLYSTVFHPSIIYIRKTLGRCQTWSLSPEEVVDYAVHMRQIGYRPTHEQIFDTVTKIVTKGISGGLYLRKGTHLRSCSWPEQNVLLRFWVLGMRSLKSSLTHTLDLWWIRQITF